MHVPFCVTYSSVLHSVSSCLRFVFVSSTQGTKTARRKILQDFVLENNKAAAPEIEARLANGACLFLTRVVTSLRLVYPAFIHDENSRPLFIHSSTCNPRAPSCLSMSAHAVCGHPNWALTLDIAGSLVNATLVCLLVLHRDDQRCVSSNITFCSAHPVDLLDMASVSHIVTSRVAAPTCTWKPSLYFSLPRVPHISSGSFWRSGACLPCLKL